MNNDRIRHDVAVAGATALLHSFCGCLREEERRDAFDEFYRVLLESLDKFQLQSDRMMKRLDPTNN